MQQKHLIWLVSAALTAVFCVNCGQEGPQPGQQPYPGAYPQAQPGAVPTQPGVQPPTPQAPPPATSPGPTVAAAPPMTTAVPAPAAASVPGVPDLDPNAGGTVGPVRVQAAKDLNKKGLKEYKKKNYTGAIGLFVQALQQNPSYLLARYNLACTYALSGQQDTAMALLRQFNSTPGCASCFKMLNNAAKDKDFASLAGNPEFQAMTTAAQAQMAQAMAGADWIGFDQRALDSGNEFVWETNGLPAISEDGKRIAVAYQAEDGMRGNPNLALQIIDVEQDKVTRKQVILDPDEYEEGPINVAGRVRNRIAQAHKLLVGTQWKELKVTGAVAQNCGEDPMTVQVGGVTLVYSEPRLEVRNAKGQTVLKRKVQSWSSRDRCVNEQLKPSDPNCDMVCSNQAVPGKAWLSGLHHVVLVRVSFCGTDMCVEPNGVFHAIKLQ